MALQSPGIQISINDQSQYVSSNVGSVPLVVLATAQDKLYNGAAAIGTSKANAGKLLSFTSQRDLVTAMGSPAFQFSSANSPKNGDELNEYGLLTAYSALGISNQLFAIRADIDLNQLKGTSVRPIGSPADGTYWLDLANTNFGVYQLNATQDDFTAVTPLLITDQNQVTLDNSFTPSVPVPKSSIGQSGSFAYVFVSTDGTAPDTIRLFYKAPAASVTGLGNTWVQVGSPQWQQSVPVVTGSLAPTLSIGDTLLINNTIVTSTGTTLANLVTDINSAMAAVVAKTGGVTSGSATITISDTSNIKVTQAVSGTGIPSGSRVVSIVANTSVTISSPATATGSSVSLSFTGAGIYAHLSASGFLELFATSSAPAQSGIPVAVLTDGNRAWTTLGIAIGTYRAPGFSYGTFAQQPSWLKTDTTPRPAGSVWIKSTSTGSGFSPVVKKYNAALDTWATLSTPLFSPQSGFAGLNAAYATAIYALDPSGGGAGIEHGQVIATSGLTDTTYNALAFSVQSNNTTTKATGGQLASAAPFTIGDSYTLRTTVPGSASLLTAISVTLTGTSIDSFITDTLTALSNPATGNQYVSVVFNSTDGAHGSISFIHASGGQIVLQNVTGTPVTAAKFGTNLGGTGYYVTHDAIPHIQISNWNNITTDIVYQTSTPYTAPADGTLWYFSNEADIDVMINNNGWKGYATVSSDVRGYNLTATDKSGVIISAGTAPVAQNSGAGLVAGDLWLDSADLVNYPKLYRYNGSAWLAINNTDQITSNGIIFADARWDSTGTTDVISGTLPVISDGVSSGLLFSSYIDQDAPDYRLYPRGTLLFNTRRSGFNVKKFVKNYFNATAYPNAPTVPGADSVLPTVTDAWVSTSGLKNDGSMYAGSAAQRNMIVAAMRSAIDSNLNVKEDIYNFNLLAAPGYPEVIPNLVNLNNARSNTGFIIGDTPMTLAPDTVAISQWVNNTNSNGLPAIAASDVYTAIYYPAGLANDLAGNTVVVPASYAALRTFLYSDNVSYPWFSPAGVTRGLVSNLNDIGYIDANSGRFVHNGINQGLRDSLYALKINPITQLPGTGLVIWGQQTRNGSTSSRSNVNVVRLENYLRTIFKSISNGYLFQPNDSITRKSIARQIEGALHDILAKRGIYDFLVVCDTNNNTSSTIANNQLYVDVAIEPMRDVEFIYIPIALYNPGQISTFQTSST